MIQFRFGRLQALLFVTIFIVLIVFPVQADELYPTITDVYFTRNGVPWNESVEFTVNCYGYACKSWDCKRNDEDLIARLYGNYTPELVFSYHATCPTYGCRIYEPYYHAERNFGTTCNLEGVTKGREFRILNFSQSAIPGSCSALHQFMRSCGRGNYCNETPEYNECIAETRLHRDRCNQYIAECDPGDDPECRNWIRNGKNVKETPSYRACVDTVYREQQECEHFLERIDPERMVMWIDSRDGSESAARRACELRFEIPVENYTESSYVPPLQTAHFEIHSGPPAASFWCSIVEFLGGRCE